MALADLASRSRIRAAARKTHLAHGLGPGRDGVARPGRSITRSARSAPSAAGGRATGRPIMNNSTWYRGRDLNCKPLRAADWREIVTGRMRGICLSDPDTESSQRTEITS